MSNVVEEVKGLYKIIKFKAFRRTEGVSFDLFPMEEISHISSMDRVVHQSSAISPGSIGDVERPWYMHEYQADNLIVFYGAREVEIYTKEHGEIEQFLVTPDKVYKNGQLVYDGPAILVWPRNVFHRIVSTEEGSVSLNLAVHYKGFDIKSNFNIYDLNIETGEYKVIREGFEDQF